MCIKAFLTNQFDLNLPLLYKLAKKIGNFDQVGQLDQVGYFDPLQTLVGRKIPYPPLPNHQGFEPCLGV